MESEEYMNRKQQETEVKERLVYSSTSSSSTSKIHREGDSVDVPS